MPENLSLQEQREFLISWIERQRPQGSLRNTVTVVFDGQSGMWGGSLSNQQMKVMFSSDGQTADDLIKRLVEEADHKKNIIVVTDDRAIQYAVRASGAKVLAVKEFFAKTTSLKSQSRQKSSSIDQSKPKNISKTVESEINSELTKIWLNKKNKGK